MTRARHQFQAWLEAANRDSRALARFFEEHCPSLPKDNRLGAQYLYLMTGGFDLRRTDEDSETRFAGVLQDRAQGHFRRIVVEVEPREPWSVTRLDAEAIPPPLGLEVQRVSEPEALAAFKQRLEEAAATDSFSGAALVTRHGVTVFSAAHGPRDRERGIPNTPETRFRMASMGKIFTAVAVVQLAQSGLLSLTEPIGRYLPDYPDEAAAGRVTAHHLLTHTSGVSSDPRLFWQKFDQLRTLEDHMLVFGSLDLEFEPGSRWAYSNYGFELLGLLVQRVAQQDYYEYVREHVFESAEMRSAGFDPDEAAHTNAVGYLKTPEGQWQAAPDHPATPGGNAYAAVEDFKRFADALLGHRLLDAEHTRLLTEGKVEGTEGPGGSPGRREAYGVGETVVNGVRWLSRTGSSASSNGELRIYPDSGYVVVVLTNIASPAAVRMSAFIGDRLPAR
jgi:D-alanyl-D-alanine carboxypeptidase